MSISEVERFAASLKSNADLRVETGKAQVAESSTTPLARAVAFAGSKGYRFTADEVKDYARATAVRLKREQIQLVADGDVIGAGMIG